MQIKTTMRYHLTPVRMGIIRKLQTTNAGEGVEKRETSCTVVGNENLSHSLSLSLSLSLSFSLSLSLSLPMSLCLSPHVVLSARCIQPVRLLPVPRSPSVSGDHQGEHPQVQRRRSLPVRHGNRHPDQRRQGKPTAQLPSLWR